MLKNVLKAWWASLGYWYTHWDSIWVCGKKVDQQKYACGRTSNSQLSVKRSNYNKYNRKHRKFADWLNRCIPNQPPAALGDHSKKGDAVNIVSNLGKNIEQAKPLVHGGAGRRYDRSVSHHSISVKHIFLFIEGNWLCGNIFKARCKYKDTSLSYVICIPVCSQCTALSGFLHQEKHCNLLCLRDYSDCSHILRQYEVMGSQLSQEL